jgi:large-conductance mechanosensitive channel
MVTFKKNLASHADFSLLAKLNELTAGKYNESAVEIEKANEVLLEIFEKCLIITKILNFFIFHLYCMLIVKQFQPQLEEIEKVEENLTQLEQLVKNLDEYSKLLEIRIRKL